MGNKSINRTQRGEEGFLIVAAAIILVVVLVVILGAMGSMTVPHEAVADAGTETYGGGMPIEGNENGCGLNPITGRPGFSSRPLGAFGGVRLGDGGRGHFNARRNRKGGVTGWHSGVDVRGIFRMPVYANRSGTVTFTGWFGGGGGKTVIIKHHDGATTTYMHNDSFRTAAYKPVNEGNLIALTGFTGNSKSDPLEIHVHFEVVVPGVGRVDPAVYLNRHCNFRGYTCPERYACTSVGW